MVVSGISSAVGTSAGTMGMNQASDSISKDLLRQIDEVKKKLQELSSNEDMSMEEKMKKRQELQKQITDLNSQLRQHQVDLRRKATEEARKQKTQDSAEQGVADENKKAGNRGKGQQAAGLSKGSMQAMISADGSMKQAKVQGSVARQMEGKAGVLEAEIKLDAGRGGSTQAKEKELAAVKDKAESATAAQMDTLSKANETVENARDAEGDTIQSKKEDKEKNPKVNDAKEDSKATDAKELEESLSYDVPEERSRGLRYKPVDVRL